MKEILIYYKTTSKYDSIYLQTILLSNIIEKEFGVKPRFIDKSEFIDSLGQKSKVILLPYGTLNFTLLKKRDYSNVVLIYHNITPANYFWSTEPHVAVRALMGRLQLRVLSKWIKNIVAVSNFNKEELMSLGYKNVFVCPNIVLPAGANGKIGKTKNPSLLYVGRIVQNKDCIKLLEAVQKVAKKSNKNMDFYIVGRGKEKSSYYKKFQKAVNNSENSLLRIIWLKNIDEQQLISLYKQSWLYITMSKHEGFGLPVCESIINGTPAIYTSCGGQESVLDRVGMFEHIDFADNMENILFNDALRNDLLAAQRDKVKNFISPHIDKTINKVYKPFFSVNVSLDHRK